MHAPSHQRIRRCALGAVVGKRVRSRDVLEHIEQDERVLREINEAMKPGGGLLLTVPQHPRLWSAADVRACHQRRYTRRELIEKVQAAGFTPVRMTSFVTLLLPTMALSRLVRRDKPVGEIDVRAELQLPPVVNMIFKFLLSCEIFLIKAGISPPVGGSRLVVGRKPEAS